MVGLEFARIALGPTLGGGDYIKKPIYRSVCTALSTPKCYTSSRENCPVSSGQPERKDREPICPYVERANHPEGWPEEPHGLPM